MLWMIISVLLMLWLIGFLSHVGGALIHLILVLVVAVFLSEVITGRRRF